jgi:GET complex subunit GET2
MLVALMLPHLPPPFPSIILNVLKYFQIGNLFLDDVAGLVVGVGFLVLFAGWLAGGP